MIYMDVDGQKLAKIALGAAEFGSTVAKDVAFNLMDIYFENGGNVIDTGRVYAAWLEGGANASESTIGEWIKSRNVRDKIWIATKGGHPPCTDHHISRINKEELNLDINESLHYLQTDYVDIYYLHRDDVNKPVEEIMPILDGFVKEGKAKYIGVSNWSKERIIVANRFAEENGLEKIKFSEVMWSYAKVNKEGEGDDTLEIMDDEQEEWYKNNDIILMPFSSQAQGFYSNVAKNGLDVLTERQKMKYINDTNLKRLEKAIAVSKATGVSPTAAGLAYLLYHPIKAVPIIGGFNKEFLMDSLQALNVEQSYFEKLKD